MKLRLRHLFAIAVLPICCLQTSCTTAQQQGAVIGGLAGAALGGIAGHDSDDVLLGAALGAGAGAGAAALGEEAARKDGRAPHYRNNSYGPPPSRPHSTYRRPPNPPQSPPRQPEYPVARRTTNPNEVISPYPPYNVIDVTGFKSGSLARDPSNKKIFRVP